MIDFKVLFFHWGNFFLLLSKPHLGSLYKKNFRLHTIGGKKSFCWLELLVRWCANGLKLYICRGNTIQMLKTAFSWQTSRNHTETESKIFNKRIPQSLTFGTDIN